MSQFKKKEGTNAPLKLEIQNEILYFLQTILSYLFKHFGGK
jgi:hypothetical protein